MLDRIRNLFADPAPARDRREFDRNLAAAALLVEAGDYESARSTLTAGIAASPRNYQLYQDLVLIDLKSTGIDAAIATAERLMAQDREFATIRTLKGDVYMASNRPTDAVAAHATQHGFTFPVVKDDRNLIADKYGFPMSSVDVQTLKTNPNIVATIAANRIDAVITPNTFALSIDRNKQGKLIGWVGDEAAWQLGAAYTSTKIADGRREFVNRFVRAYKRGMVDYADRSEEHTSELQSH